MKRACSFSAICGSITLGLVLVVGAGVPTLLVGGIAGVVPGMTCFGDVRGRVAHAESWGTEAAVGTLVGAADVVTLIIVALVTDDGGSVGATVSTLGAGRGGGDGRLRCLQLDNVAAAGCSNVLRMCLRFFSVDCAADVADSACCFGDEFAVDADPLTPPAPASVLAPAVVVLALAPAAARLRPRVAMGLRARRGRELCDVLVAPARPRLVVTAV